MKVLKFGGTSVGSIENMISVKNIINDKQQKVVVLSAMSGTTNALVEIYTKIQNNAKQDALKDIQTLEEKYQVVLEDLFENSTIKQKVDNYIQSVFTELKQSVESPVNVQLYNSIVAKGELLSTFIFAAYLETQNIHVRLLNSLDFMRVDKSVEPDYFYIQQNLNRIIQESIAADIYIVQGFICLDNQGRIANLQRGGSDYTATIIGAVLEAEEVQIWTDIDGLHNNDPRYVQGTQAIADISYDEAAELAYFGAKILHPLTVTPAKINNTPVRLKNTMEPNSYGTLITKNSEEKGIKAIAAKSGITAIKIKSERMLNAYGFLKKVFEIFEKYETPIDMITTSEITISLTIDNNDYLNEILVELKKFASVEMDLNQTIICLVGKNIVQDSQTYHLFKILQDVPVRMISYGGSDNNISILVNTDHKIAALKSLNNYVFNTEIASLV